MTKSIAHSRQPEGKHIWRVTKLWRHNFAYPLYYPLDYTYTDIIHRHIDKAPILNALGRLTYKTDNNNKNGQHLSHHDDPSIRVNQRGIGSRRSFALLKDIPAL